MAGISTSLFLQEVRDELSDSGTTQTFQSGTLTRMLAAEFRKLHSYGIDNEVTNWDGTLKTSMPLALYSTSDFAIPANWTRITEIQFWTDETIPQFIAKSAKWDDRVLSGYVTIYDAPQYFNDRIKLIGQTNWTDVTDTTLRDEVIDVLKYGVILRATKSLINKRAATRKFAATGRSADSSMGSLAFWHRMMRQEFEKAKVEAEAANESKSMFLANSGLRRPPGHMASTSDPDHRSLARPSHADDRDLGGRGPPTQFVDAERAAPIR